MPLSPRSWPLAVACFTFAATGCDAEQPSGTDAPLPEAHVDVAPGPPTLRRLTTAQYQASVRDLLGPVSVPAQLEPDAQVEGLASLGASVSTTSPRGVEQYEAAAFSLAEQAVSADHRDRLQCAPDAVDDTACFRTALTDLAHRAWRRPLGTGEADRLVDLATQAATTLDDPWQGLVFGLAAILQSPSFLYREELGEPDPDDPTRTRYTSLEMASRLSFALWGTLPDAELLAAAEAGELVDDTALRAQVERMVAAPRARDGIRAFFAEVFDLDKLPDLSKDPLVFPHMSPTLGTSLREETLSVLEHIVFDTPTSDLRQLLTTRTTFVNHELAALYGLPAPDLDGWGQVEHPVDGLRRGLLGQGAMLALYAHPVRSSITRRGKFVRTKLLCHTIDPAPVSVDTSIPEATDEAASLRDRVEIHLSNPACASCHNLTDPIGLALENFDGVGAWREFDNGVLIDPSGDLDGLLYDDPVQLAEVLRDHEDFGPCMTHHLFRYTMGRDPTEAESTAEEALADWFVAAGYPARDLLTELVTSPAFRHLDPDATLEVAE